MKVPIPLIFWSLTSSLSLFPVLASGQASDRDHNLSACQQGWAGCDRSKLSPSEAAEVALTDHRQNVSDCRDGLKSCDRAKLGDAERTALAVADHQNNVTACNDGIQSCDRSRLTPSEARDATAAERLRNVSDCPNRRTPAQHGELQERLERLRPLETDQVGS